MFDVLSRPKRWATKDEKEEVREKGDEEVADVVVDEEADAEDEEDEDEDEGKEDESRCSWAWSCSRTKDETSSSWR